MLHKNNNHIQHIQDVNAGMIALLPAIIVSGILLLVITSASTSFLALLSRSSMLDNKNQSVVAARACVRQVLSKKLQNNEFTGGLTLSINGYLCVVGQILTSGGLFTISASVSVGDAATLDTLQYNPTKLTISGETIL